MPEYELVDEPPPTGRNPRFQSWKKDFIAFLEAHPGKWAKAPNDYPPNKSSASTTATMLKQYGCEAVTRRNPDTDRREVFARWPDA